MTKVIVLWMVICGVWWFCLWIVKSFDETDWVIRRKEYVWWIGVSLANAALIENLRQSTAVMVELSVLAGCMIFACMTDIKIYEVYGFVWWIGAACGAIGLQENLGKLPELVFFCFLQEKFFCRFYGRADCHAFVICALVQSGMGLGLREYLIHMLFAFGGLAVIQLRRNNINRRGNLKQPVAFLPYITVSFWLNCYCFCWEKMI